MTDQSAPRPAIFLDRDGTLIEDPGYLADPATVRLLPGVATALIALQRAGYLRFVVTNQSGIGRGHYPQAAFEATQRELERQLREAGASLDATYCCPHTPDAGCPCRKPGTALHREAIASFDVDIARSWCVGDQIRDLEPAVELGCQALLVRTGQGARHAAAAAAMAALVAADLAAGAALLSRYI